jgi:hypothetical protein
MRNSRLTNALGALSAKRRTLLTIATTAIITAALTVATMAWLRSRNAVASNNHNEARQSPAAQPATPATTVSSTRVLLKASGFESAQVTRKAGRFFLTIDKPEVTGAMTVQLNRQDGKSVAEIAIPQGAPIWSKEVDLSVGVYQLRVVDHPEWMCNIIVQ